MDILIAIAIAGAVYAALCLFAVLFGGLLGHGRAARAGRASISASKSSEGTTPHTLEGKLSHGQTHRSDDSSAPFAECRRAYRSLAHSKQKRTHSKRAGRAISRN